MLFLQTWQDSLKIFTPKNGKTFLLLALNSIKYTYTTLVKNFWWVLAGYILLDMGVIWLSNWYDNAPMLWLDEIVALCYVILPFIIFLVARPALEPHDFGHSLKYFKQWLFFYLYLFLFGFLWLLLLPITNQLFFPLQDTLLLISPGYAVFFSPLFVFTVAFMLDSRPTIPNFFRSFIKAVKMCFYNYPLVLLLCILFYYLGVGCHLVGMQISAWIVNKFSLDLVLGVHHRTPVLQIYKYLQLIVLPIPVCVLINVYVQKAHEQFERYFAVKG